MEWNSIERATFQAFRGVVPSRRQLTQMIDTVRSYGVKEQESAGMTWPRTQNESGSPTARYSPVHFRHGARWRRSRTDRRRFHRAGDNDNRSRRIRRAVNNVFSVPISTQQISLPSALSGRHSDDPELSRLLGYDSARAGSVLELRARRLRRNRK